MRLSGRRIRSCAPLLALLAALLVLWLPLEAAPRQLVLESMQVQALVLPSSAVAVRETIAARFEGGPWQGLLREIPVVNRAPGGAAHRLGLSLGTITDAEGVPYRSETSLGDGERRLRIFIPDAAGTTRTAVIRYRVEQAIRFFPDHDEFYWNVTGSDRKVPIEQAAATILLPQGTNGIRAAAYTGVAGATGNDAEVSINGNEVRVVATRPLQWNEGLTVAVAFDKGTVRQPGLLQRLSWWLQANWIVAMPLLSVLVMLLLWQRWGRDPRQRAIVVRYEPPPDLAPAEAGALIDDRVDGRDLIATLVDLAVRGFISIGCTRKGSWLVQPRYRFTLNRPQQDWPATLRPHERSLLLALFDTAQAADQVDSEDLENVFYQHIPGLRTQVQQALIARGCFRFWPGQIRLIYACIAGVVLLSGPFAAAWLSSQFGMGAGLTVACFVLTAAPIAAIGWLMPRRTQAGTRLLEQVRGYERFVDRVDRDRFDRAAAGLELNLETFERGLPYAMAFGLSRRWSQAFAAVLTTPPSWISGGFDPGDLGADLDRFANATTQTLQSSPRSSSGGSGFGGGGSVGGGFGGGSVGGF